MALHESTFVTVSEVKSHIDATSSTWDTIIESLINEVTFYAMNYCGGRRFLAPSADVTELYDVEDMQNKIFLQSWPIKSLTSVSYSSGTPYDNPTWTTYNAATDFIQDVRKGILHFASLPNGYQNIKVVYKGGYDGSSNVPHDLKLAIIKEVAKEFNKRKSQGIQNESIGGGSIAWEKAEALNALLDNYRRFI